MTLFDTLNKYVNIIKDIKSQDAKKWGCEDLVFKRLIEYRSSIMHFSHYTNSIGSFNSVDAHPRILSWLLAIQQEA